MDETLKHHNPNPTLKANWLSKIFFWWMNPLFKTGYVRQLEVDDMYNVVPEEHSENLGQRLEQEWAKELERTKDGKRKPSLFRALFRIFGFEYIMLGFVLFLEEGTKVIQPLLLGGLIRYFTPNTTVTRTDAYLYAGGVSLCALVLAIAHHPYFFGVQRIGMKMRIATCSLIYRKSLRLSNSGLGKTTTGQIVNLMSNDVNRFDQAVIFLHFLWVGPVEAIAILAILWRELGPSTLAGFAVLLLLVPVQGWMGKLFSKFRQKTAKFTDDRVRVMNEIIAGMRVIKMYCWEKPFGDLVEKIRRSETKHQRQLRRVRSVWISLRFCGQFLSFCATMIGVIASGRTFTIGNLYVSLVAQILLTRTFTFNIPVVVRASAELSVIFGRLQIRWLKNIGRLESLTRTISSVGRYFCVFAIVLCLSIIGVPLRATNLFVWMVALNQLRSIILSYVKNGYMDWLNLRVSVKRVKLHYMEHLWSNGLRSQIAWLKKINRLHSVFETTASWGRYYCMYAIVLSLALLDIPLRASSLFVSLVVTIQLQNCILRFMLMAFTQLIQLHVSVQRTKTFLLLDELKSNEMTEGDEEKSYPPLEDCFVEIDNVTGKWDPEVEQATLSKVSASVKPGKLLAVIGPVGAGKSSLLMSVLKELPTQEGSVEVKGRIAYVAQQPWVFSASLRQNIVFGNKYDKSKYDRILKACALNRDVSIMPHGDLTLIGDRGVSLSGGQKARVSLARALYMDADVYLLDDPLSADVSIMPHGDLTLIGDRGVSLSGGQKARVSLARALYMDADVYLLDDPLSAVDASVGRHIFDQVVQGMLKSKPRILVTHQLQYLQEAEEILILKDGEMIGKGTFNDLSVSGVDFSSLLKRDEEEESVSPVASPISLNLNEPHHHPLDLRNRNLHGLVKQRSRVDSSCSTHSVQEAGSMMSLTSIGTHFEAETVQLPEEEERHEGTVGVGIYVQFFRAGAGILKFLVLLFLCVGAQVAYVMSDWWLSRWSNEEEARYSAMTQDTFLRAEGLNETNITIPYVDTHFNISIFSGIIASVFLLGLLRALMFFKVAVDASQTLHNKMFQSILRSHIGFFDTNPVGRILNRFSKDIGHMDDLLPITFFDFVQCGLLIVGIVIVAGVVNPWVFIPVVPLIGLFYIIRRYYLRTSRHIKRLEGTTRSPVFSHLSASLQGLQTIRAFGVQSKFVEEFDNHQDLHTESWFLFLTASRWLAVRLDWLCALFVAAVSFSCVLASESLSAGLVGLSMTYAMTLMGMFQWGVRQSAEVENQMISVERVLAYMNLPSEAPLEVEEKKQPPSNWPQNGVIAIQNACLRYSPDAPLVLKDLNFTIEARQKIGIVGRTGAGKSSLITMLFRLVEPSGSILIDDINIQNIGLHDLRNKISIIPQDPVLFTGTLRRNLDPFGNHDDVVLWKSLEEVQLKQAIEDLPHGLDTEVSEGGINFSVGQRQLICLARAILRNNRILMIDEATANVDPRTDALIQETIREKFNKCTVLTIAHRLNTIMDSDRLLLLDEGHVAEYDIPYLLLQKRDSQFRKLVEQTGKSETMQLLDIAKKAYKKMIHEDKDEAALEDVDVVVDEPEAESDDTGDGAVYDEKRIVEEEDEVSPDNDDVNNDDVNGDDDAKDERSNQKEVPEKTEDGPKDAVKDMEKDQEELEGRMDEAEDASTSIQDADESTKLLEEEDGDVKEDDEAKETAESVGEDQSKETGEDNTTGEVDGEDDEANESESLLKKDKS